MGPLDLSPLDLSLARPLAETLPGADFRQLVAIFAEDVRRLTAEMEAAPDAGAWRAATHGIAGAAASVGAVAVERAAREAMRAEPAQAVARIRAAAAEAVAALAALAPPNAG